MEALARQVKRNCDISDAKHWGFYSICGLLLRLRELYLSEHGLRPWHKIENRTVIAWVGEKEAVWKTLVGEEYSELEFKGTRYPPFDSASINNVLVPEKLLYGAGYGPQMKATFFLAELLRHESSGGLEIYIAGKEHARDLSNAPAMLKENVIVARLEAAEHLIWQKYEEFRTKSISGRVGDALALAFESYDISPDEQDPEKVLGDIALPELEVFIRHELGEAVEGKRLGPLWADLLLNTPDHKSGFFLRSLKDVLADTSPEGMLMHIISRKLAGSLGFYFLFLSGYRKLLSREIETAFKKFISTNDWAEMESAVQNAYEKARAISEKLLEIHSSGKDVIPLIEQSIANLK
jgi:hypothetical protein